MDDKKELYAEAMLGKDAEEFLLSDVGRFLVGRSEEEAEEAMNDLKSCDPNDAETIKKLQNRIWRAESFAGWIGELIVQGRQALAQLESSED